MNQAGPTTAQWTEVLQSLTSFISVSTALVENLRNAIEANVEQQLPNKTALPISQFTSSESEADFPCPCAAKQVTDRSKSDPIIPLCSQEEPNVTDTFCHCPSKAQIKKSASKSKKVAPTVLSQKVTAEPKPETENTPTNAELKPSLSNGSSNGLKENFRKSVTIVEDKPQTNEDEPSLAEDEPSPAENKETIVDDNTTETNKTEVDDPEDSEQDEPPPVVKPRVCPLAKKAKPPKSDAAAMNQTQLASIGVLIRENLQQAQKNLEYIEEQLRMMERLSQDFDTKNTPKGQVNPAALYKEIMKPQAVPYIPRMTPLANSTAIDIGGTSDANICCPAPVESCRHIFRNLSTSEREYLSQCVYEPASPNSQMGVNNKVSVLRTVPLPGCALK